jgi:hypothetical protein
MSDLARRGLRRLTGFRSHEGGERTAQGEASVNAAFAADAGSADATVHVLEEVVRRHSRAASTILGSPGTAAAARPPAVATRVVRIPAFRVTATDTTGADTGADHK